MTISIPELIQRNATFAAGGAFKGPPFPSNPALRVIGSVDSRVDPSGVLGLKLGEECSRPPSSRSRWQISAAKLSKTGARPLRIDVGIAGQMLPPELLASGLVHDVGTGLVDVVVPATMEQRRV